MGGSGGPDDAPDEDDASRRGVEAVGRLAVEAYRHPRTVLATVLLVTLILGAGLPKIHTDVDVADVLPRGNDHTKAAHNITTHFKSTYTQEMELQFRINPDQCREDSRRNIPLRSEENMHCGNITDEVYVRAMEELFRFLRNHTYQETTGFLWWEETRTVRSPVRYQIGLPSFMKLFNWTLAGGQDEPSAPPGAYSLPHPNDRARSNAIRESGWQLLKDTQTPTMDPSHEQAVVLYMVPSNTTYTSQEIGAFMLHARDAYLEWAPEHADYKVFTGDNKPLHTVDFPVANAHSSQLAREDFQVLLPLIAVLVAATLYAAFRNARSVLLAGSTITLGAVWTYGLMGHMGIAMNPLNLTVLPLLLGNGVDYAIHLVNEFLDLKHEGLPDEDAFRATGERAGVAMLIATLTTVSGLLVMVASPSLLMAQLGLLSAVAMASIFLLTLAYMPAALALAGDTDELGADFQASRLVPAVARTVHRHRAVVAVVLLAAVVLAGWNTRNLTKEEFGEPALNWPRDDPLRREHERGLRGFYDVAEGDPIFKTNIVVVEGDITDPETLGYVDALSASLHQEANRTSVVDMHTSRDLPFLIRSWLKVCCGPQSLVTGSFSEGLEQRGYEEQSRFPQSRSEVQRTLDDMFRSPYATFSSLFVDHPRNNITVITLGVETGSYENARIAWNTMDRAVDRVEPRQPDDVHVSFVGNTATNYLFIQEELPYLNYMAMVSLAVVVLLVLLLTRDLKATLTVGAIVGSTSLLVLGLLPLVGIGLAITLMLPLVFIFSIGSDYAVHLAWNMREVGDPGRVYRVVGKAVLFSAVTDAGAFLLFLPIPGTPHHGVRDLMARDAMAATVLAILVIFLTTLLVMGTVYDPEPEDAVDPRAGTLPDEAPATR